MVQARECIWLSLCAILHARWREVLWLWLWLWGYRVRLDRTWIRMNWSGGRTEGIREMDFPGLLEP